ncbi:hypothetical protein [Protaetiibacter larvae]|uniref:Uncharacterized protein n=1 Tax=Protaetiibacter larvae TaxID=2592654 RepID=A0A5C1Y479_9MICO|nr:hypothetical protein [Protaetiibacter larvae]QEO08823.1 hypothetical protein FLP23_01595 [Protaetiibacter larvae]
MSDGLQIFDASHEVDVADEAAAPKRRPRWPGGLAGGLAILMVVTAAVAFALATSGRFELGLGLAISATLLSGLAVVAGLVAVIGRWGRGWGIAAIAVGVLLNPVVLLLGLSWLGAL